MTKIDIDDDILEKITQRAQETEFKTAKEYIHYVLSQVVERLEKENESDHDDNEMSKEDEEKVKERLRALGYLD